jgi:hypothetical protein
MTTQTVVQLVVASGVIGGVVGGIGGGLIASYATHLFTRRREQESRKQDCLEQVIEDLGEQESAFDNFCVSSLAYNIATKEEKPDLAKVYWKT